MSRSVAMLIEKALNFLKPCNDAFVSGCPARGLFGLNLNPKLF